MEEDLMKIGLSKNEAKAYLKILELGKGSIGEIAKKSKIHRTSIYDSVEGLLNKGLISFIIKDNTKFYQVNNPKSLLQMIKDKEEKINEMIPKLELMHQMAEAKNEANVYEGLEAVKRVMDNFLAYKDDILVMGVSSGASELVKPFLTRFHKRRVKEKIRFKHIYNSDADKRMHELKKIPYTEIRVLPGEFDSPVATNIVGDEVTLIHWVKNAIVIQIKSEKIASVYKRYFEILWNQAELV